MGILHRELRIGNYVKSVRTGEVVAVDWIAIKCVHDGNTLPPAHGMGIAYEPIPITEELLLKCGFSRADGYYYIKCDRKHITFSLPVITHWIKKPFHTEIGSPHSVKYPHIRFLHQLQNLYFALTCEELEVKP